MECLEVAADLLAGPSTSAVERLHPALRDRIKYVDELCGEVSAFLTSPQVIALLICTWQQENPTLAPYEFEVIDGQSSAKA
jgi:hypothetical protein